MNKTAIFLLMLLSATALADYPIEVIELRGRQVEEIIPVIRPFVASDGSVTGMNNQLILRTSPENLQEIRQILKQVDRAPRRLMISVRQGGDALRSGGSISADIDAKVGNNGRVTIGQPSSNDSARIRGLSSHTRSNLDIMQKIHALEGRPAFIATGQSIPVTRQSFYDGGPFPYYQSSTMYRDATIGFYALPRVNGDHVTLEIIPHMERTGSIEGTFDVQRAATVLSGRLGEWISLGGAEQRIDSGDRGIGYRVGTKSRQNRSLSLMVEEIRQ